MKRRVFVFTIGCLLALLMLQFVSSVSITRVSSTPEEVIQGQTVELSIDVKNTLEYDVTSLNIKLNLGENVPFAPYQSSSEKFLDVLEERDSKTFRFRLIALPSAESGIYKIPVIITYFDDNNSLTAKNELVSLIINSEPELRISVDDSTALIREMENALSIKVVNSGMSGAKFVYLSLAPSGELKGVRFLSEKERYMGDIDSDDFDSVEYKIYIKEDAPKAISIPVRLKFRDATNKEFVKTETLILKTYSLKEAEEIGLVKKKSYFPYIIVIILAIAYIIYKRLKKRKIKKNR